LPTTPAAAGSISTVPALTKLAKKSDQPMKTNRRRRRRRRSIKAIQSFLQTSNFKLQGIE
jgi:hypothetical protein